MILMVSPRKPRTITAPRIDSGIDTAMMIVLRQLPRKIRIISAVRAVAMIASRMTPLTAELTNTDWSASSAIRNSGGSVWTTRSSEARIPFTTSMVDAVPAFRTLSNTPR